MSTQRVVVVTGGASGMGLGISQRFAARGHSIVMLDVQAEALEAESAAIREKGGSVLARRVDVSRRDQIDAAYAEARETFGPIGAVIAAAGISAGHGLLKMSIDVWQRMIDVNLTGVFHSVQAALPDMIELGWGRIVTISSHAGQVGAGDRGHYAAAKGGVIALTKSLAREFARYGITANTVPPSLVDTPLARGGAERGEVPPLDVIASSIPIARAGTSDEIAAACEFLCSDDAAYITGQQLNVNGGAYM